MSETSYSTNVESLLPVLHTDLFDGYPKARFATGLIGHGTNIPVGLRDIFTSYAKLRAGVYIDETGYLPQEAKNKHGAEIDNDDVRSTHFCVAENMGESQRIIASMRIIHGGEAGTLPIEKFFSDLPYSTNHSGKSIEISRYICRHEDKRIQSKLKWILYPTVLAYIMHNSLGPAYAVVDEKLESQLAGSGVPISRIAPPMFIKEYNTTNVGIMVDTEKLAEDLEQKNPGSISGIDFSTFTYSGDVSAGTYAA